MIFGPLRVDFLLAEAIDEELTFSNTAKARNITTIKHLYAVLKTKVAANLAKVVDMDAFRDHILGVLDEGSIPKADSVQDIFRLLSKRSYWKFTDVSTLEQIVEGFGGDLEEENMSLINSYKEKLNGYNSATRIVDFVKTNVKSDTEEEEEDRKSYVSLQESKEKYDDEFRTNLSIKLLGKKKQRRKIHMESLKYVEKLWDSLCMEFDLPSLPHVLDDIVAGCVVVCWIVQHKLTWKILQELEEHTGFFERETISLVCLEGVCIYNQKYGVREKKVLVNPDYTLLIFILAGMLCQTSHNCPRE